MRHKIYQCLVNKHPGISVRYHKKHDGAAGAAKLFSWIYLLWLNFAYYFLFCHFLGRMPEVEVYEEKRLSTGDSESAAYLKANPELSVNAFVEKLSQYDIISFDIFDTLIFRPLALPTDLFYLIGQELEIMDFKNIRIWAEWDARVKYNAKQGNMEIGLTEIWDNLREDVGSAAGRGEEIEKNMEIKLCYANPFMLAVWQRLEKLNKKIIIVSDMYLPKECIAGILKKAGYTGAQKLYISNEYQKSKADGQLYREVLRDWYGADVDKKSVSIVHVGDNPHSDWKMAGRYGIEVLPYQNVNKNALLYRAFDLSPMIGSAYRAIVSNWLYCGWKAYSIEYEYGFLYGGLFVLGYCTFIHDYCEKNKIDKLLFLSRDGDILKQAYDFLYPKEDTEYVYWSRKAATKLEAVFDKHDYFRRFIYHYEKALGQAQKAAAIDIGWAGSGAMALRYLVSDIWKLDCDITGIIAGTNTIHNAEPDAAEAFLQSGKLAAYLYSQSHNRDLLKKHDPNKDYNVFWELLLSSPTPQFSGFYEGNLERKERQGKGEIRYLKQQGVSLAFGKYDANQDGIREIQKGILDFVKEYYGHYKDFPYMLRISGRDAYAPMLVAASHDEKYLGMIEKRFDLEINVT